MRRNCFRGSFHITGIGAGVLILLFAPAVAGGLGWLSAAPVSVTEASFRLAGSEARSQLAQVVEETLASGWGLDLGMSIHREGEGIVFERAPDRARPAASAIKTFVALDLLRARRRHMDRVPPGLDLLLTPGVHPAFSGFGELELRRARGALHGATYRDLVRIMMGNVATPNDVYNAACNVIMIKLGGPRAIQARVRALHPDFSSVDINRYMMQWRGDGDNLAAPRALLTLYRLIAAGSPPGLNPRETAFLQELLQPRTGNAPEAFHGKAGTLYPAPMTRVQAGYLERGTHDLSFAIMGEMRPVDGVAPADAFVVLLASVDSLASFCRRLP